MTQKEFIKDLFEKSKEDMEDVKEIMKIIEILKSEKEEAEVYTTVLHST